MRETHIRFKDERAHPPEVKGYEWAVQSLCGKTVSYSDTWRGPEMATCLKCIVIFTRDAEAGGKLSLEDRP